jgi:EmrB/QacA subfamily drug resistance transporter
MVADQATVLIDKTSAVPSEETSILNVVEISEWINSVPHSDRLSALVSDRAYTPTLGPPPDDPGCQRIGRVWSESHVIGTIGTGVMSEKLARPTKLALVAMAAGVFLIANDFTALSVAIPAIESEFSTTLNRAQWVINGYTVVFGVLIVTGGRLADRFGRKRMFMIGAVIFGIFSLVGAMSPSIGVLIGSRAAMGVGGAFVWPAILGMTYAILPEDKAGLAGGLIIGVAGLGNAFGPLIGGILTDTVGWRYVFVLNVPVTLLAMWIVAKAVPDVVAEVSDESIDYTGIASLSGGVVALLVGLDIGTNLGFTDTSVVAFFVAGAGLLVVFAFVERRSGEMALVPRSVLNNRQFMWCSIAVLALSAIFFAALLYLPQLMEIQFGFSAVGAGVGLLPLMLVFAGTSFAAGPLYARMGAKMTVASGAAALGIGMLLLSLAMSQTVSYMDLVPGMLMLGIGVGLFYSSITTAAVTALDPSQASLAGGVVYMCQVAGGSLGLGFNTAIVLSGSSITSGIAVAFLVDAFLAGLGFLIAVAFIGDGSSLPDRLHLQHRHRAHAP